MFSWWKAICSIWLLFILLAVVSVRDNIRPNCGKMPKRKESLCEQPNYKFRILSYHPFIAHIENFLTEPEQRYLLALGYAILCFLRT